jgi:ribosomal protein S13
MYFKINLNMEKISLKNLFSFLKMIYGFGFLHYKILIMSFGFNLKKIYRVKDLDQMLLLAIMEFINTFFWLGEFYRKFKMYQLRLVRKRGTVKAYRHNLNLPVRGQHTQTNARTQKRKFSLNLFSSAIKKNEIKKKNKVNKKK